MIPGRVPLVAILAGGKGRRMGRDKVGVLLEGVPLIERVWRSVAPVAGRVIVVGGRPRLDHLGVPTIPDRFPGAESMGGIATALSYAAGEGADARVLVVGCDMPLLSAELLVYLDGFSPGWDVVVPRTAVGYEPLCAVYRATSLAAFEERIAAGALRIFEVFEKVRTREVAEGELRRIDPELRSFLNVNRPEDLDAARRLLARG